VKTNFFKHQHNQEHCFCLGVMCTPILTLEGAVPRFRLLSSNGLEQKENKIPVTTIRTRSEGQKTTTTRNNVSSLTFAIRMMLVHRAKEVIPDDEGVTVVLCSPTHVAVAVVSVMVVVGRAEWEALQHEKVGEPPVEARMIVHRVGQVIADVDGVGDRVGAYGDGAGHHRRPCVDKRIARADEGSRNGRRGHDLVVIAMTLP